MKAELWKNDNGDLVLLMPGSRASGTHAHAAAWTMIGTVNLNLERSLDQVTNPDPDVETARAMAGQEDDEGLADAMTAGPE